MESWYPWPGPKWNCVATFSFLSSVHFIHPPPSTSSSFPFLPVPPFLSDFYHSKFPSQPNRSWFETLKSLFPSLNRGCIDRLVLSGYLKWIGLNKHNASPSSFSLITSSLCSFLSFPFLSYRKWLIARPKERFVLSLPRLPSLVFDVWWMWNAKRMMNLMYLMNLMTLRWATAVEASSLRSALMIWSDRICTLSNVPDGTVIGSSVSSTLVAFSLDQPGSCSRQLWLLELV